MYSAEVSSAFPDVGFPIRRFTDRRLLTAPRDFSQFCHVLHRLLVPRHPPSALTSLTTIKRLLLVEPHQDFWGELVEARRQAAKSQSTFAIMRAGRVCRARALVTYPKTLRHAPPRRCRRGGRDFAVSCELARLDSYSPARDCAWTSLTFCARTSFNYLIFRRGG